MKKATVGHGGTQELFDQEQSLRSHAAPQQTPSQRAAIQAAVNRERARCAAILERAIAELAVARDVFLRELLEDRLARIRSPWRVRAAARKRVVPGRLRRCCGICGADDHRAPKCPGRPS